MSSFFTALVSCVNYDDDIRDLNEEIQLLKDKNLSQDSAIDNVNSELIQNLEGSCKTPPTETKIPVSVATVWSKVNVTVLPSPVSDCFA